MQDYQNLYKLYIKELDKAVTFEEEKIESTRERLEHEDKSEAEIEEYIEERFDPICCSGRVIAVFRKYWLLCHELNIKNENETVECYVNPKDFTVEWLSLDGDPYDLFDVIEGMPYYPIGIDENGEYC